MTPKKINLSFIKKNLPKRTRLSSKIDGGKVLIVAGGKGLYGAGILSALSATRSGAGYTYLMSELKKFNWLRFPDFIVHPLKLKFFELHQDDIIAIGPGLGVNTKTKKIIEHLLKKKIKKVILDADALTVLSQMKLKKNKLPSTWILTPHEGELARLVGVTSQKIKADRKHYLELAQNIFGCVILLKGAESLVATDKKISSLNFGTIALAKAGTGDVLLGMIAAFYAQKNNPELAVILGSGVHGLASKAWLSEKNDHLSMRPVDLIEHIPKCLAALRKS